MKTPAILDAITDVVLAYCPQRKKKKRKKRKQAKRGS
jgi:hypothetical protein